ncbi:MAG: YdcF family protein [Oscillospiraceae bacterium]|nr:YdcF family protein [Oscillospiraceae bacterium]
MTDKARLRLKKLLKIFIILVIIGIVMLCAALGISEYVKRSVSDRLLSPEKAAELTDIDCIIVLGCRVNGETPSPMLSDRLLRGIELYNMNAAPKLLMSGDHGQVKYDEVNAMKQFAIDRGVPSEDVFMDHAGFSTYETMYRAKEVFAAKRVMIVTQSYHLYRAVYIAEKLGLEAWGVDSDLQSYIRQPYYDMREILARDKDFVKVIFKPEPTYLGEVIPISGSGDLTNDKEFT